MYTLIITLLLAIVFFISITDLIRYQKPFLFEPESREERKRACNIGMDPDDRMSQQLDPRTLEKLRSLEENDEESNYNTDNEWTSAGEEGFIGVDLSSGNSVNRNSTLRRTKRGRVMPFRDCCVGCCPSKSKIVITTPQTAVAPVIEVQDVEQRI